MNQEIAPSVSEDRQIKFGSITITTNGFSEEISQALFERENFPSGSEHPANWSRKLVADLSRDLNLPQEQLPAAAQDILLQEFITRLSANEIHQRYGSIRQLQEQLDKKATFEESKGFFEDFRLAHEFCSSLKRVGIHGISSRVHSSLFTQGQGEAKLESPSGVSYIIRPTIWIEGYKHHNDFYLTLYPAALEENGDGRKQLTEWMVAHPWKNGCAVDAEHWLKSTTVNGKPKEWKEIANYIVESKELDVYAHLYLPDMMRMMRGIPIAGKIKNLEPFVRSFVAELDEFFADGDGYVDLKGESL